MTIQELHSNEALRRHEFPVANTRVFLGHAGVSPVPRRVAEAMAHYSLNSTLGDRETLEPLQQIRQIRALAAGLISAQPEEIAFVGPTSLALSHVASGLTFRKGDNILVYFDDYPSNVYPWMALAEKGVQVRFLNTRELGRIRTIDVTGQVDEQTRLVALSSCHFVSGFRLDIRAIGEQLRKRGILFCLDAIQTVGAFPTPADCVDFLAADSHKWMLGPCAAGILYVRKEVQDRFRPPIYGWNNIKCPDYVAQESLVPQDGGRRYEPGTENIIGLVGLRAAMELLRDVGIDNIAAELLRQRTWLVPALQAKGYTVLQAEAPSAHASSLISIYKDGVDPVELHAKLLKENVVTLVRADRSGKQYLRISPHFYNTDAELHRLLELL